MTWRRGALFISAVLALALIRQRAPDFLPDGGLGQEPLIERAPQSAKVEKKAKPMPPPPPASYFQLLQDDRFCEVIEMDVADHREDFIRSLHLDEPGPVQELVGPHSPFFTDPSEQTYSAANARFMQAMVLSGQLEGSTVKKLVFPLYEEARRLLLDLETEDPQNAAYTYFRLEVEKALGRSTEELAQIAERILTADRFESHSLDVRKAVRARMTANASKYIAGVNYVSTLPVLAYGANVLVRMLDVYVPGLNEHLAELMTAQGTRANTHSFADGYDVLEYLGGRSLAPWLELPNHIEIDKRAGWNSQDFSKVLTALEDEHGHKRKCDEWARNQVYAAMREID
ncbi:MAG: hypothetical protein KF799_04430 [Bdellovibrionales bacterium]|nr:hypothetical protein [Bdellovibrionales bacterium]